MKLSKKIFFASLLLAGIFTCIKSKKQEPIILPAEIDSPTVSYFLVDGLSQEIFEQEMAQGNLPHLKYLSEKGAYIKNGIVSFPSMTGYAFYPFLTGIKAQKSGILGLRWFDRSREYGNLRNYVGRTNVNMNLDIDTSYKNLFELSDPYYTVSLNSYMNRGVTQSEIYSWAHTTSKYQTLPLFAFLRKIPGFGKSMIKNHFEHESLILQEAISQLDNNPKVQWITFAGPDAYNHIHGTDSTYLKLVRHVDNLIGEFIKAIDEKGQKETRHIVIVSDHGVSDVNINMDIRDYIPELNIERGKCSEIMTSKLNKPINSLKGKDGYFVINGDLCAYLYMSDPSEKTIINKWSKRNYENLLRKYPSENNEVDLINRIANITGVEFVAYAVNDTTVGVQVQDKKSKIIDSGNLLQYQTENGDVFNYNLDSHSDTLAKSNNQSKDEWLDQTYDSNYPDALNQLSSLFNSSGAPDLVICSKKGYDLAKDYESIVKNFKGGHGGLRRELLSVPMILYGPKILPNQLDYARSEDVGATCLELLEYKVDYELDGKILAIFRQD